MQSRLASSAILVTLLATLAGCVENGALTRAEPARAPEPLGWELTPAQQRLMMQPVSPEATRGRPSTAAELEEARRESVAVITAVNRYRRDRGADTLPHCLPQCEGVKVEPTHP